MNNVLILQWLKSTNIPLSVIARKTKITRKSLHNWRNGSNPSHKSLLKLTDFYNSSVSVENESNKIKLSKDGNIDKDYVLKLQEERIQSLEKENTKTLAEDYMWDTLPFDFEQSIQLKWHISNPLKVQRAYIDTGNIKLIQSKLGFTSDELNSFYDPYVFYDMNEHPVNGLLSNETQKELSNTTQRSYGIVSKLLAFRSRHFIPLHLKFRTKNKNNLFVPASSCIRINSSLIIEAKTKFL